jgi:hypothetical protein
VSAQLDGERIVVTHDWALSDLRRQFLAIKLERYWCPLLRHLHDMQALPEDWEAIMRSALFCCPTLVMSQLPGPGRAPAISLLGFAVSMMCGSGPEGAASDVVSELLNQLRRSIA